LSPCSCKRVHGQALGDPSFETGWRTLTSTWCKGVTSASQAEALQLKSEGVHFFGLCPWPRSAYTRRFALAFEGEALQLIAEFRKSRNASPLRYSGEHFLSSRRGPGFNSRRRVFIFRVFVSNGFHIFAAPHSTIMVRQTRTGESCPSRGEPTPRCLSHRALGLKRDALRGGCNTPADWRSGWHAGLIAQRSEMEATLRYFIEFGRTEAAGRMCSNPPQEAYKKTSTSGFAPATTRLRALRSTD
jgi:hypothetical protein